MATIPVYDSPQVRAAPLQGGMQQANVPEAAFTTGARQTGQLAQGFTALGEGLDKMALRDDMDQAFRAETAIKTEFLDFDNKTRQQRRGAGAKGYAQETDAWWKDAAERVGKDLSPRAKQLVGRSLFTARQQGLEGASRWENQELDRSQIESYTASQAVEIQRSVTTGDPAAAQASAAMLRQRAIEQGAARGWTPEIVDAEAGKWTSQLHKQMIGQLANTDPLKAKEYFELNRAQIDSADHARTEHVIKGAVNEVEGKRIAMEGATLPYAEQVERIAKLTEKNPDLRKAASTFAKEQYTDVKLATAEREAAASDKAWQAFASGASISGIDKNVLASMNGRERAQLNEAAEAKQRRRASEAEGKAVKTDLKLLGELYDMPPEEFAKLKPEQIYQDKISRGDLEELIKRRTKILDPGEAPQVASTEQQMNVYASELKLKGDAKGAFNKVAYDEFNQFAKDNKREPNYDERQKILDKLTIKKDQWLGTTRYYEVAKDPKKAAAFVPDISSSVRETVKEAIRLKRMGLSSRDSEEAIAAAVASPKFKAIDVSDAEIMDLYKKQKGLK